MQSHLRFAYGRAAVHLEWRSEANRLARVALKKVVDAAARLHPTVRTICDALHSGGGDPNGWWRTGGDVGLVGEALDVVVEEGRGVSGGGVGGRRERLDVDVLHVCSHHGHLSSRWRRLCLCNKSRTMQVIENLCKGGGNRVEIT